MGFHVARRKPTFLWQALLIVLPVGLLATVGFVSLRQDKYLAEVEAAQRAQAIAADLLPRIEAELFPTLESRLFDPTFQVAGNGDLLYPPPIAATPRPGTISLAELSPEQARWWTTLQETTDPDQTIAVARQLVDSNSPTNVTAAAWYAIGLAQKSKGKPEAAAFAFREITLRYPTAVGETGIPLRPLAELQLLAMTKGMERAGQRHDTAESDHPPAWDSFCQLVMSDPSPLSGYLLDQALALAPPGQPKDICRSAKEQWLEWELLRRIHDAMPRQSSAGALANELAAAAAATETNNYTAYSAALARIPSATWVSLPEPWPMLSTNFIPTSTNTEIGIRTGIDEQNWFVTRLDGSAEALSRFLAESKPIITQSGVQTGRFARVTYDTTGPHTPLEAGKVAAVFLCRPEYEVGSNLTALVQQARSMPDYFGVGIEVAGRHLSRLAPDLHTWQRVAYAGKGGGLRKEVSVERATRVLASATGTRGGLKVNIYLTSPSRLFERQATRTFWFGSLIGVAGLAALAGLASAWRAFVRQQALNEMKSNFVSSVSHELRAPIASVRLLAESLDLGKIQEPGRQREYFRFIVQECRRLSGLIENVLDFSRIEQGRKRYEFEPTDLFSLVRQTAVAMEPYAADHGVRLALALPGANGLAPETQPETHPVLDGKAIQQALINLVDNAIKYSPKDGIVTLGIDAPALASRSNGQARIQLWVEDNGPGIPQEEHEKIFERFYRCGSELRRETPGVGIGLSIVKHIVEAHGGSVRVRSAPGQGSRFTIDLPMDPRAAIHPRRAFFARPASNPPAPGAS